MRNRIYVPDIEDLTKILQPWWWGGCGLLGAFLGASTLRGSIIANFLVGGFYGFGVSFLPSILLAIISAWVIDKAIFFVDLLYRLTNKESPFTRTHPNYVGWQIKLLTDSLRSSSSKKVRNSGYQASSEINRSSRKKGNDENSTPARASSLSLTLQPTAPIADSGPRNHALLNPDLSHQPVEVKELTLAEPLSPLSSNDILGIEHELVQENSPSEINFETLVEETIIPSIHTPANHKVISDLDMMTRPASPEIEVVLLHNRMQRQIHYCLTISNNPERSVIAEMAGIDILVIDPNLSTLIEIKTGTDILLNIRQAVGQLLEYEFFNREKIPGYKVQLMIVSPAELNDEAKEYLTHLRLVYDLNFKYEQYVPDSLNFIL